MADRLTLYLAKSVAKYLGDNVAGVDAAYVVSSDFDYDKKVSSSDTRLKIARALPFVAIEITEDQRVPFTVSANTLYEANITLNIGVFAASMSDTINYTGDMKQALNSAVHPVSGKVGVPLYDFSTPSGVFYDLVNAVDISDFGVTNYFGPVEDGQKENMKHRSYTPVVFSAFKDKSAILLEGVGNFNLYE